MLFIAVAILGTLIPTMFYVLFVWWLDRYEKEPLWLLTLAFLWGAGPAAILSAMFELMANVPLSAVGGEALAGNLLSIGVGAPVIEESFKGIALIGLVIVFPYEFDDVLDGIVYGAMIGFGFALTENLVTYLVPIFDGQEADVGLVNLLLRTVIFGANHGFWTGITGAAVGYARMSRSWAKRLLAPVGGWALAVIFHSFHNLGATMVQQALCLSLTVLVIVNWGGVMLLLLVAMSALRRESSWIEWGLAEEVNLGVLTQQEFDLLRSPSQRLWAQWQAYTQGGRTAANAVGSYFKWATELAFRKRHLAARHGGKGDPSEIQRLRRRLAIHRQAAWPWLWPSRR
jgi:RsiW-degrading membrane proteinase PrsW (M82 family)